MDYNQFKNLLQLKGLNDKESVPMLEELIEKFPYFQSARMLLAKAMHDQENINYNDALKLAAAYSTDREALQKLVEQSAVSSKQSAAHSPQPTASTPSVNDSLLTEDLRLGTEFQEYYSEDEISGRAFEEQKEKEKIVDPYEVIRKRLSEILVIKEEPEENRKQETRIKNQDSDGEVLPIEKTTPKIEKPIVEEKQETFSSEKSASENIIIQEAGKAHDVLDRMEIEHAMEESILASLEKLPIIQLEKSPSPIPQFEEKKISIKEEVFVTPTRLETSSGFSEELGNSEPKSFTKWLKSISHKPFHQFEEVHLGEPNPVAFELSEESQYQLTTAGATESEEDEEDLIDRFISTEPRIIPSKAEFYSPANQARKSVMENEDVVSETLARIYRGQGNLAKAKWCYEKLSLLHPEKSVYFAALIEEIKNEELKM